MPDGKPAGVRCIHLTKDMQCAIYQDPDRPKVCNEFMADEDVCGNSREEAVDILTALEGSDFV